MHKNYRYSYSYNGKLDSVFRFSVKNPVIRKNRVKKKHLNQFSDKSDKNLIRKKTHLLKLEFCNADRKMKGIIRCIFISIIIHPNFIHFCQKISFKSALEIFTPVRGHLRTALKKKALS